MKGRKQRPSGIRIINSLCAITLVFTSVYIVVFGIEFMALGILGVALAAAATPVLLSGEGIFEILLGIVQVIVDGILDAVLGVVEWISDLFG